MATYSKRGDDGTTALIGGERRPKDDLRVETYGTLDELSSMLGLVVARCPDEVTGATVRAIQGDLFALAARLAAPGAAPAGVAFDETRVTALEAILDDVDRRCGPLQHFVRPGGHESAAWLHLARTVCRRAERRLVALHRTDPVEPLYLRYVNRLADALFALARQVNHATGFGDEPVRR